VPPLLKRLPIDPYVLAILATVGIASVFPCQGQFAAIMGHVADAAIMLLFFLYGGRLARKVILTGVTHWRLQLVVLLTTFVLFPLLGIGLRAVLSPWMSTALLAGIVFLTVLPSTVQSSIAFTSIARGNVPAAICSATISNLSGVLITPVLVALLLGKNDGGWGSFDDVWRIFLFLLLPFTVGQLLRPLISNWLDRRKALLGYVDRGSILLVVYIAFSKGVVSGIWREVPPTSLLLLLAVSSVLLAAVLVITTWTARRLGFRKEDEVVAVFCGSKKSLASGLPMAKVLFAGPSLGLLMLPLMIFHALQLIVCAALARHYARQSEEPS
jgi:solute carrier family 10 (sodium/bile acid cotransporter), member 7